MGHSLFTRWIQPCIHFLYPQPEACLLCGMGIKECGAISDRMCRRCEERFTVLDEICVGCGRQWKQEYGGANAYTADQKTDPLKGGAGGNYNVCGDCRRRARGSLVYSRSAAAYCEGMRGLIARYKFRGDRYLAPILADFLRYAWKKYYTPGRKGASAGGCVGKEKSVGNVHGSASLCCGVQPDLITYIPLHVSRLRERTFNQTEELAHLLGAAVGVPVLGLLDKVKATEKQSQQNRRGRMHALDHAFSYREEPVSLPEYQGIVGKDPLSIVIIDDIYTTGSTLNEAAHVLKMGVPNAKVYGLTVAR